MWGDPSIGAFPQHCLLPPQLLQFAQTASAVVFITFFYCILAYFAMPSPISVCFWLTGGSFGAIVFGSLLTAALSNPGICMGKDGLTQSPPDTLDETALQDCVQCKVIRPKEAIHCDYCDCCMVGVDHHCPFIGRCIAKNNKTAFRVMMSSIFISTLFMVPTSALCVIALLLEGGSHAMLAILGVGFICCLLPPVMGMCRVFRKLASDQAGAPLKPANVNSSQAKLDDPGSFL
jgi:hypothetical protein